MSGSTVTLHRFTMTGEFLTERIRDLWKEGNYIGAYSVMEDLEGMSIDHMMRVVEGKAKFVGNNEFDLVPDNWAMPEEDYMTFKQALGSCSPAERDELAVRRKEEGLRLLKDAAESEVFFTYRKSNFMGMGENNTRVERMVERANKLIADPDLAEETYSDWLDHYHDLLKKGEQREAEEDTIAAEAECREMAKTPKHTRRWSGGSLPLIARDSSIEQLYMNVRNAMYAGAEPDAMPSEDAIMNRGMNIVPKLDPKMTSVHGWLLPNGNYYGCGAMEHVGLATNLLEKDHPDADNTAGGFERLAESLGWMKITLGTTGFHVMCFKTVTKRQKEKLFDYCERHNRDYETILSRLDT